MAIELDTTKYAAQLAAANTAEAAATEATTAQKLTALLGGSSLTVTDGSVTDLEALVARLKNDQEKTKYSMLLTSLSTIGDSLSVSQKKSVEEGMQLTDKSLEIKKKIVELDKELKPAEENLKKVQDEIAALEKKIAETDVDPKALAKLTAERAALEAKLNGKPAPSAAEAVILQAKIDTLTQQIENAVAMQKEHNEAVRKLEAQKQSEKTLKAGIEEKQKKREELSGQLSKVNGKISAIVSSIDVNVLKTIANEFAQTVKPEENETNAEEEKRERKADEVNIFFAIRDSIDRLEGILLDTVEENRPHMV